VVDDSVVARRVISDVLLADPGIDVVGVAPNGRIALAKIPALEPDVLTLDVDMPDMSGLETLAHVRKLYPRLRVIMCSTLTERGAAATLDALSRGATDYVTKPSTMVNVAAAMADIRQDLIPKIKALCQVKAPPTQGREYVRQPSRSPVAPVAAIVVGASTGGPNALLDIIPKLPPSFPSPILIVQHMPPIFTRLLAERLDALSSIRVKEGVDGETIEPGCVWVAPGNFHVAVEVDGRRARIRTHQGAHENSCRPSADVLFRSAAALWGNRVLGVVLTGMGRDGEEGSMRIKEAGGQVLVQDQASSVVWGMPGCVFRAGYADEVVGLRDLPMAIVRRVEAARRAACAVPAGEW
jgi:two-component system chemotaxis response regulator CheB